MNRTDLEQFFSSILIVIGVISIISLILGLPLWILWNLLMPKIFGLPYITFWQAVGMNLLSSILFKNSISKTDTR